jgi:serine/threonine protein kinase
MGKMIDEYHLMVEVGKGQYGKVYKAKHMKNGKIVAIKCISMTKFSEIPKLEELTRNEISILSSIKNPNCIQFKEMLRTTNNMYMVYEFCNGGNLEEYLRKKRRLSEKEAFSFIKQVINACYSLEKRNILHRDLKL